MTDTRRHFIKGAAGLAALAPFMTLGALTQRAAANPATHGQLPLPLQFGTTAEEAHAIAYRAHEEIMAYPGLEMHGSEQVAMLVYPGMTVLDLVGPQYFFASMMGANVHLVSKDERLEPVMGDTGFAVVPTLSLSDCPADLDILFVPGGTSGTVDAMLDEQTVEFVADRGGRAAYVTSVCTGSLILGQAGLLENRRATSHWAARHLLPEFGAEAVNERVVTDGNVVTGAGVSAGLDFALALLARLRGDAYARAIQLQAEYAPEPIFDAGTPESVDPKLGEPLHKMFATTLFAMRQAAAQRRKTH